MSLHEIHSQLEAAFHNEDEDAFKKALGRLGVESEERTWFAERTIVLPVGWSSNIGTLPFFPGTTSQDTRVRILTRDMRVSEGLATSYRWSLGRPDDIIAYSIVE